MRNSLVISFAEGSMTEEEFLILYEKYQSEEQGYKLKLTSFTALGKMIVPDAIDNRCGLN